MSVPSENHEAIQVVITDSLLQNFEYWLAEQDLQLFAVSMKADLQTYAIGRSQCE